MFIVDESIVTQSEAEILSLLVDESLSDIDRAIYLFKPERLPIQRYSVIESLINLCIHDPVQTDTVLFPILLKQLPNQEEETRNRAACIFTIIIERELLSIERMRENMLNIIFHMIDVEGGMQTSSDYQFTTETWLQPLIALIPKLDQHTIENKVKTKDI